MPNLYSTEVLEIDHEQVFPAHRVTKLFELEHGDFSGVRGSSYNSRNHEPSWRLVDEKGTTVAHLDSEAEIMHYIQTTMQGQILSRA